MIRWLFVSWAANAVTLGVTGLVLSGVTFHHSVLALLASAAVFGVLNTILKPILKLLTLPFAIVTLGIVWFFVAMLMLWLTDLIVGKFSIHGFWTYVWATVIVWVVNIVVDAILSPRRGRRSRAAASAA
ncbi:MAG TPA: phage holin family protein [Gaiellaceae bacterium]|jgi:putative membrane protein|nr:phage holin family protein [Gaiellaceae bacterium]